ncbi:uncharacterized protein LOC144642811 [Oculina patagonica]
MRVTNMYRSRFLFILSLAFIGAAIYVFTNITREKPVSSSTNKDETSDAELNKVEKLIEKEDRKDDIATEDEKEEYKTVNTLLFFVGYSRSRHTLLASLLDGHPHMIVANERNLFYRLRHGGEFKRSELFDLLVQGSKGFLKGGKGMVMSGNLQNTTHFGFWMKGYWQGAYDKYIEVIGDKTAWLTSGVFRSTPKDELTRVVDDTEKKYGVKVKFIHLIRNPFDIISTITLRNTKQEGGRFGDHSKKVDDPKLLEHSMERFFRWAEGSAIAREVLGDRLLDVNGLELVTNPVESMSKICKFIEITCPDDFLQACVKVVDPTPSITRNYVVWSKEHMDKMYSEIEQYPFLAHYTFDS